MPIPDFQTLMLPALKFAATTGEHALREAVEYLANQYNLSAEEKNERLPSGKQPIFYNRVGWARTYLKQAGLLETSGRRNYLRVSNRGKDVLSSNPTRIDMKFLEQYPEYLEFRDRTREVEDEVEEEATSALTPEELLDSAYRKMREDLAKELLENIIDNSPKFFENLVVELLVKMGYGGSSAQATK